METADLEVRYVLVDKELIIEAIVFCLKNGFWVTFFPFLCLYWSEKF